MKVFFHDAFYDIYTHDPAAAEGRMEAVVQAIATHVTFVEPAPATVTDLARVHTMAHIDQVQSEGLFDIAALAAGGAMAAAEAGLTAPCFALIRPPGHHASGDSCWGFCYFNNMAVAIERLKDKGKIDTAFVLDFDLHYGDGNVNILGEKEYVTILNPQAQTPANYLEKVQEALADTAADIIGVSAGFDNHEQDWGGLLSTANYRRMGQMVRAAARCNKGGCFGILEGGYNHGVLGQNVLAFIEGLSGD